MSMIYKMKALTKSGKLCQGSREVDDISFDLFTSNDSFTFKILSAFCKDKAD